jgi:hypothetical protein
LTEPLQRRRAVPRSQQALILHAAILKAGGILKFRAALGVSHQAIYHWMKKGRVPLIRAAKIEELYGTPARDLIDPAIVRALSSDIL